MTTPPINPTQADRDAAAAYLRHTIKRDENQFTYGKVIERQAQMIELGSADAHPLVQAFARHRLSTPSTVEEPLRSALEKIAAVPEYASKHGLTTCEAVANGMIVAARAALKASGSDG